MAAPDPTATAIKLKFPEFASKDDTTVQFALEEAIIIIGNNTSNVRPLLIGYLTAHILAVSDLAGQDGGRTVTHESIGKLSTSYAHADQIAHAALKDTVIGDLQTTSYGRRYQQLLGKSTSLLKTV